MTLWLKKCPKDGLLYGTGSNCSGLNFGPAQVEICGFPILALGKFDCDINVNFTQDTIIPSQRHRFTFIPGVIPFDQTAVMQVSISVLTTQPPQRILVSAPCLSKRATRCEYFRAAWKVGFLATSAEVKWFGKFTLHDLEMFGKVTNSYPLFQESTSFTFECSLRTIDVVSSRFLAIDLERDSHCYLLFTEIWMEILYTSAAIWASEKTCLDR